MRLADGTIFKAMDHYPVRDDFIAIVWFAAPTVPNCLASIQSSWGRLPLTAKFIDTHGDWSYAICISFVHHIEPYSAIRMATTANAAVLKLTLVR